MYLAEAKSKHPQTRVKARSVGRHHDPQSSSFVQFCDVQVLGNGAKSISMPLLFWTIRQGRLPAGPRIPCRRCCGDIWEPWAPRWNGNQHRVCQRSDKPGLDQCLDPLQSRRQSSGDQLLHYFLGAAAREAEEGNLWRRQSSEAEEVPLKAVTVLIVNVNSQCAWHGWIHHCATLAGLGESWWSRISESRRASSRNPRVPAGCGFDDLQN